MKGITMPGSEPQVLRSQGKSALWLQRLTIAGALFFFLRGLAWLAAGADRMEARGARQGWRGCAFYWLFAS